MFDLCDFDAYVNKTMEFQVVKLNMFAENVVVSHRALIENDLEEQREQILNQLNQVRFSRVQSKISPTGCIYRFRWSGWFCILPTYHGVASIASEIVQLDQRLNVAVIEFDERSKRVSLGLNSYSLIHGKEFKPSTLKV